MFPFAKGRIVFFKNSKLLLLLTVAEVVSSSVSEENVIGLEHPSATANIKKHDLL